MATAEHTNNRMQKNWWDVRGYIAATWPKLNDTDLDRINGNFDRFLEYLREYYGGFPMTEAIARAKLNAVFNDLEQKHPDRE